MEKLYGKYFLSLAKQTINYVTPTADFLVFTFLNIWLNLLSASLPAVLRIIFELFTPKAFNDIFKTISDEKCMEFPVISEDEAY